jgi:hypothetical protein
MKFIFSRPDSDHPYIKVDQIPSNKKIHDQFTGLFIYFSRKIIKDLYR